MGECGPTDALSSLHGSTPPACACALCKDELKPDLLHCTGRRRMQERLEQVHAWSAAEQERQAQAALAQRHAQLQQQQRLRMLHAAH